MQTSKRDLLIKNATTLFYQKGLHAVGINEVLKYCGIAKKTLYHHFSSKEALIVACLEYRHKHFMKWMSVFFHNDDDCSTQLNNFFKALDLWFKDEVAELGDFRGCFFINSSAEYLPENKTIVAVCQLHKNAIRQTFETALLEEKIPPERAAPLSEQLLILMEGCITRSLISGTKDTYNAVQPILQALDLTAIRQRRSI